LPTQEVLHRRIITIDPICQRCGAAMENIVHMLFQCTISRLVWFQSPLALRTEALPENFKEVVLYVVAGLQEEQITLLCNTLWQLWKAMNEKIFQGRVTLSLTVSLQVQSMSTMSKICHTEREDPDKHNTSIPNGVIPMVVDAAWSTNGSTTATTMLFGEESDAQMVRSSVIVVAHPFHTEVLAARQGIEMTLQHASSTSH
jgi:zinc-binding in reverse transcriptase